MIIRKKINLNILDFPGALHQDLLYIQCSRLRRNHIFLRNEFRRYVKSVSTLRTWDVAKLW